MKITKQEFLDYEKVRKDGSTNMFNLIKVQRLSHIDRETLIFIMKHYGELKKSFGVYDEVIR